MDYYKIKIYKNEQKAREYFAKYNIKYKRAVIGSYEFSIDGVIDDNGKSLDGVKLIYLAHSNRVFYGYNYDTGLTLLKFLKKYNNDNT